MPPSSPTARQRQLGVELKKLRRHKDRDLSTQEVADRTGLSQSKVSRIENAKTRASLTEVGLILDVYGVDSGTRARLLQLTREAQQRGWWVAYGDVFIGSYIGFEDVARRVRTYETMLIPGLLQTGRYARAVIEAGRWHDPADVDKRVQARRARQALLDRPDAPSLDVVIDEAALRRPVGGVEVMREQLRALLDAGDRPDVSVRVLPFAAGAHGGMDGPFTILSFEGDPDMAYVESRAGNTYLESTDQMRSVTLTFERIWDAALPAEESAALIAALIKE
jgi:transcriptional regulator with XRE-family HTH domain